MSRFKLIRRGRAVVSDTTPDAFTFTDVTGAAVSTVETSNTITVAGLGSGVSVSVTITGGTYSKNGGSYTSSAGTAVNGDTFAVRHTSSASGSTATDTVLTIGGVGDTFTSTTVASIIYDTRWGTDTAATALDGWIRLAKNSGNRQVWVDSVNGNDANSGLSRALAKQTWAAAWTVFLNASFQPGDQFMVAYGEGQAYTDPGTLDTWRGKQSYALAAGNATSAAYPTAVITYDSRDPTNANKYGRSTRGERPWLTVAVGGTICFSLWGDGTHGYAVQGIGIKPSDGDTTVNWQMLGRHDHQIYQNVVFNRTFLGIQQTDNGTTGRNYGLHVSKCAAYGAWASGGSMWMLIGDDVDGTIFEDFISIHSGWRIGQPRTNEDATTGGANFFAHGIYFHAGNGPAIFRRRIFGDTAADGDNYRADHTCEVGVLIREPIACTLGGYSSSSAEDPDGNTSIRKDELLIDSAPVTTPSNLRGWAYQMHANIPGSTVDNVLAINNSQKGLTNNCFISIDRNKPEGGGYLAFQTGVAFSRVTTYNWYSTQRERIGTNDGNYVITWTNCKMDDTPSGTGNSTSTSGDFPGKLTNQQIYAAVLTACGRTASTGVEETTWNELVNIMLYDPTQPWPQKFLDIVFPAYGKTPTYPAVTITNLSADTPLSVY